MKALEDVKSVKWKAIAAFYAAACGLTYLFLQLPNLVANFSIRLFGFDPPFNWNHGLALFTASLLAYRLFQLPKQTTLLGTKPLKSILFSAVFLIAYTAIGIRNKYGVEEHLWAFIFCSATLVYDVLEESAWRGFLNDAFRPSSFWLKAVVTGIMWSFWHLLVFDSFAPWGGFHYFVVLSVIASVLIGYATERTNAVLVAASVHALLILKDMHVTVACLAIWLVLLLTWSNTKYKVPKLFSQTGQ
ncbi:CPBP family intramembrane glutamic endopeptidase [Pontibacter actiniarum]|uniref:CPBP family intramembrane metalloprotease n=1 Tax=Pontibacter actiniarum TaxID=323450 RepID=A0A1X9YV45_9BACT|nr:CPBP family intramembrane glutamic endopeptidase [Pontibacter actiniarum]ARS36723.1 CPBP family intramembrane metalloprotease [Pontibacter actiniarum]